MIAVRDLRKAIGEQAILRGVELDVAVGARLVATLELAAECFDRLEAAGCGWFENGAYSSAASSGAMG